MFKLSTFLENAGQRALWGAKAARGSAGDVARCGTVLAVFVGAQFFPSAVSGFQTPGAAVAGAPKPAPELLARQADLRAFIQKERRTLPVALAAIVPQHRVTLLGVDDFEAWELVNPQLMIALPTLRARGLTHLALEVDKRHQAAVDAVDPRRTDALQRIVEVIGSSRMDRSTAALIVRARRLNLRVLLINTPTNSRAGQAANQNARDETMFGLVSNALEKTGRALVVIGSAHVQKKVVESETTGPRLSREASLLYTGRAYPTAPVERLGTRLTARYGADAIASIRLLQPSVPFDGLYVPSVDSILTPQALGFTRGPPIVIPDAGPAKGDPRVTAADFIMFRANRVYGR